MHNVVEKLCVKCPLLRLVVVAGAWLSAPSAGAMVLFGLDNSANQTDPGTGVPFDAVGFVCGANGTTPQGSAINLGGGYMLTAKHVSDSAINNNAPYVTFDGTTFYQRDLTYIPTQVAPNVDLAVFRLTAVPTVGAVHIYTGATEQIAAATQVGWGIGRNPTVPIDSAVVTWGTDSTIAKRWGLNKPLTVRTISYDSYSYQAIETIAGNATGSPAGLGDSEASTTLYDSGSGLFQKISGTWYLIGVPTVAQTNGSSTFGNDTVTNTPAGDYNYAVRIGTYSSNILALIPEPSVAGLLAGGVVMLLGRRRNTRH